MLFYEGEVVGCVVGREDRRRGFRFFVVADAKRSVRYSEAVFGKFRAGEARRTGAGRTGAGRTTMMGSLASGYYHAQKTQLRPPPNALDRDLSDQA